MNDYRQRFGLGRRVEPLTTTSMGRFFANRLRDSLHQNGSLATHERENFDQTTADYEATPEPPISVYDVNRSIVTPSSTSSINDLYFTHTTPDIHKFSRRVELSSGYNILKNRTSSRPQRLPAYLQGRTPLAQLNPIPAPITAPNNNPDDNRQRRLSFTDHNRQQNLAYNQHMLQQFNVDGTRRPFSSDSPLPPTLTTSLLPPPPPPPVPTATTYYAASAPLVHSRTAYEPIEPLKLVQTQEEDSIAQLSRELRAAAYPTTRKSNHSPVRETSPSTTRYSTRTSTKRAPPRSLPKIHTTEQQTPIINNKTTNAYHHHEPEPNQAAAEDRLQSSSTTSLLLDQFFNAELTPRKEPVTTTVAAAPPATTTTQTHETPFINHDKSHREHSQTSGVLLRTSSFPNGADDTTMAFVSKYARLAPIATTTSQSLPTNRNPLIIPTDENLSQANHVLINEMNHHEQTFDTLHDLSSFHNETSIVSDDLLQTSDMVHTDETTSDNEENYSYVPLKEQMKSINGIPLLELDELETSSDISESQLVPIIYAKELENEIDLLQKAHLLKQKQRSTSMNHENERINDNNSVPPPANMELLNFEALEDDISTVQQREDTPLPSPTILSTMMEISPSPVVTKSDSPPASSSEIQTPLANILQHNILAHNRLSPWFKLPTELWFKILSHLNTNELHQFTYVCKRFYLLVQDPACHHKVVINRRMKFEQVWFDSIARRKPISLSFTECRQQNLENSQQSTETNSDSIKWTEFFQAIGSTLMDFTMTGCYHEPFTPNTLLPIIVRTCPNLLSLSLRWNHITESTLNQLIDYRQFIHLQILDLTGCQVLDDTLLINIFIRTETDFHLKKLILQACTNITWTSLDAIAICIPNLTHLNISRCIGLKNLSSNQDSTCFKYWSQLEYIDFGYLLTLTDNDLTIVFDNCKYLNTLILDDCINLTDQTLHRLTLDFRMISLYNCTAISTNALLTLNEQCPNMHNVNLNSIRNFNDNCLLKWSEQPFLQLRTLILDHCTECTLNGLERFLEQHFNLQELSLNGNIISNQTDQQTLEQKFPNIKFVFQ